MNEYRFIFSFAEKNRIIPSVLIDSRATIQAIKNQIGDVIKAYTDTQAAMVQPGDLFYKIEVSEKGNLVGYFTLRPNDGAVSVIQYQLRPAFVPSDAVIQIEIGNFITSGAYKADSLV